MQIIKEGTLTTCSKLRKDFPNTQVLIREDENLEYRDSSTIKGLNKNVVRVDKIRHGIFDSIPSAIYTTII